MFYVIRVKITEADTYGKSHYKYAQFLAIEYMYFIHILVWMWAHIRNVTCNLDTEFSYQEIVVLLAMLRAQLLWLISHNILKTTVFEIHIFYSRQIHHSYLKFVVICKKDTIFVAHEDLQKTCVLISVQCYL